MKMIPMLPMNAMSSNVVSSRFMDESKPIVELLKQTDNIIIPDSKPILPEPGALAEKPVVDKDVQVKKASDEPTNQVVVEIQDGETKDVQETQGQKDLSDYYASLVASAPASQDESDQETFEAVPTIPLKRELESDDEDDEEEFVEA